MVKFMAALTEGIKLIIENEKKEDEVMKKVTTYKGFVIAKVSENEFHMFTLEEWSYGEGLRTPEFECCSIEECKENARSY